MSRINKLRKSSFSCRHFCLLVCAALIFSAAPLRAQVQIFFFNPDINVKDLNLLIAASAKYFGSQAQFKAFAKSEDLEAQLKAAKAPFVIVSHWYYTQAKDTLKLKPILMPSLGGKTNYEKSVVVLAGKIANIGALSGKIATTSLGNNSGSFLDKFIFTGTNIKSASLSIIWVKKELDALMALKQNQVQASIVANKNYKMISQLSPGTVQGLEIIFTSKPIPESPLCATSNAKPEDVDKIKNLFLKMNENPDGKAFLKLLGYDKWVASGLDSL